MTTKSDTMIATDKAEILEETLTQIGIINIPMRDQENATEADEI